MSFIARRYALPEHAEAILPGTVLKPAELELLVGAGAILERARRKAAAIEAAALSDRETLLAASLDEQERAFFCKARDLECHYQKLLIDLRSGLEPILDRIVVATLKRMGWEAPAEIRLRLLTAEIAAAGPKSGARLQVSAPDAERLAGTGLPWPLEVLPDLPAGRCRLMADAGCWTADFSRVIEHLARGDQAAPEAGA